MLRGAVRTYPSTRIAALCPASVPCVVQKRELQKHIVFMKTRLPPKFKRRESPNEHKNTAGVLHSGRRLPVNLTKHYDRLVDVANKSAYHPPFLVHDYIRDTSDYILEPFNAGKSVVMNRRHVLNAFDFNSIDHMEALVKKYMNEPASSSVTFWKSSENVFSSGTNFIEILQNLDSEEGRKKIFSFYRSLYKMIYNTHNGPSLLCPYVNGLCLGSAASFAVNCPVTATGPNADLCWPETSFGFHPDAGAMHILSTLPRGIGEWMALTGSRLPGNSVVKAGLANYTFSEDLLQTMQRILDDQPQVGPAAGIRLMDEMRGTSEEPFELLPHLKMMEKCFVQPTVPDIMQALAEEAPTNEWARLQLEKLKKKSPLSLVITLEALQRAEDMNIDQVLRQDFRLTTRFLDSKDFREGVDKLIVKRGEEGLPQWEHASPADVPRNLVDYFFSPTGDEDTEFVVHGENDKENLDQKLQQFQEDYEYVLHGKLPRNLRHRLGTHLDEKGHTTLPELSNHRPSMPLEEVLADKGYTEPEYNYHLDEALPRSFRKNHYDGPKVWKDNGGLDADLTISLMQGVDAGELYREERPVSENGLWRSTNDFYDTYKDLRELFNVVQHPYPRRDSIIRGRTVSKEVQQKVETEISSSLDDGMDVLLEDYDNPLRPKAPPMRYPPYEELPKNLKELDKMSMSDDDYSTAEEEPEKGPRHLRFKKDEAILDPDVARWDSDL